MSLPLQEVRRRPRWMTLRVFGCFWPLCLDATFLGFIPWLLDVPREFDGWLLAGWSMPVLAIGFLSGWVTLRNLRQLEQRHGWRSPSF